MSYEPVPEDELRTKVMTKAQAEARVSQLAYEYRQRGDAQDVLNVTWKQDMLQATQNIGYQLEQLVAQGTYVSPRG
jgi:hypothetical protein